MKIKTAQEMIDFSPYDTWFDDKAGASVMDTDDVILLLKEYAAQFIDLAVDDIATKFEEVYGINEVTERIEKIKNQIR